MQTHLHIAGPGRAGTTLLVRYLTAIGLDTTLSRNPDAHVDEDAQAGLEEALHMMDHPETPYVCKNPWLHLVLDDLISSGRFLSDGVIIPMRDLGQAARSRLVVEQHAIVKGAPWFSDLNAPWDVWGSGVPGGALFSLHQKDMERLLAVGFYQLIERLTRAGIPFVLLHFPRFAQDFDYLYKTLAPLLPGTDVTTARRAFAQTVDPSKIRVQDLEAVDRDVLETQNAALKREVRSLHARLARQAGERQALRGGVRGLRRVLGRIIA